MNIFVHILINHDSLFLLQCVRHLLVSNGRLVWLMKKVLDITVSAHQMSLSVTGYQKAVIMAPVLYQMAALRDVLQKSQHVPRWQSFVRMEGHS